MRRSPANIGSGKTVFSLWDRIEAADVDLRLFLLSLTFGLNDRGWPAYSPEFSHFFSLGGRMVLRMLATLVSLAVVGTAVSLRRRLLASGAKAESSPESGSTALRGRTVPLSSTTLSFRLPSTDDARSDTMSPALVNMEALEDLLVAFLSSAFHFCSRSFLFSSIFALFAAAFSRRSSSSSSSFSFGVSVTTISVLALGSSPLCLTSSALLPWSKTSLICQGRFRRLMLFSIKLD